MAATPTLDDLRRIIRRIEGRHGPRSAPAPVETVLGGEVLDTGQGMLVMVRREYPLTHTHGRQPLAAALAAPLDLLSLVTRAEAPVARRGGLLFLDTETTGLAGGTGTYAFLVGAALLEEDRVVVNQYFMRDLDEEPALLAALAPLLERASGIVTFNGAGFDLPLLETRFVLARRRWPATVPHLDLLRPARRIWRACLSDCRLATLEREVFGLARESDVPGALIPSLYFEFLRSRRPERLARVFAHNRDDLLSLVALMGWLGEALQGRAVVVRGEEMAGLGRLWEPVDLSRALACYRAALETALPADAEHAVRLRLARWEKRQARWEAACALWEAAAARHAAFDPRPWEELAKFHEHRQRDPATARAVVEGALGRAQASRAPAHVLDAFHHRLRRLDRRLEARQ